LYIWAGPHHLLYSALPDWLQTAGMVFSVMLWAPSWGGMINGLLTLRGCWDRVRTEPTLKFMATAVTFYGMATFEGPLMSIKSINYMAHFTDWVVGHVHSGTIGWNYMLVAGMLLYLVPKMWKTPLYSIKLANQQYWLATIGLVLYVISMLTAGLTQGGMWRAIDDAGKLVYPNFVETVVRIVPLYWVRAVAGTLVLLSFVLMIYNLCKTIAASKGVDNEVSDATPLKAHGLGVGHRKLEGMPALFTVLSLLAILVGSLIEIVPALLSNKFLIKNAVVKPYSPLELAGRDIYIKEGCYVCHSQLVRPDPSEELRYGAVSVAEEYVYDHPFQWGSRRIGPDLIRVGGKYSDVWHYRHMMDPREVTPNSLMPVYPWLARKKTDFGILSKKMSVMKSLGVPYSDDEISNATQNAYQEAKKISEGLNKEGIKEDVSEKEITALIAYLQRLGRDLKNPVAGGNP
jgi:cytochrome c oxidase cbb3-type subunit I/II